MSQSGKFTSSSKVFCLCQAIHSTWDFCACTQQYSAVSSCNLRIQWKGKMFPRASLWSHQPWPYLRRPELFLYACGDLQISSVDFSQKAGGMMVNYPQFLWEGSHNCIKWFRRTFPILRSYSTQGQKFHTLPWVVQSFSNSSEDGDRSNWRIIDSSQEKTPHHSGRYK